MFNRSDLRARNDDRREYQNERIRVRWDPDLCTHAAFCVRELPEVFNARVRPWVAINAADADRIAEVVSRCPSGALTYERPSD